MTTHTAVPDAVPALTPRRRRAILAVVALSLMAVVSAVSGLNVALPSLARDTGASQTQLTWIVDAYTVVFAGPPPFCRRPRAIHSAAPAAAGRAGHLRHRRGGRPGHQRARSSSSSPPVTSARWASVRQPSRPPPCRRSPPPSPRRSDREPSASASASPAAAPSSGCSAQTGLPLVAGFPRTPFLPGSDVAAWRRWRLAGVLGGVPNWADLHPPAASTR